jgi:hypothetical protein
MATVHDLGFPCGDTRREPAFAQLGGLPAARVFARPAEEPGRGG